MFTTSIIRLISSTSLWVLLLRFWPSSNLPLRIYSTLFPSREPSGGRHNENNAHKRSTIAPEETVQRSSQIEHYHNKSGGWTASEGSGHTEDLFRSPTTFDTSRTLCIPFPSLKPYDFIAEGATAHVYAINPAIVVKVPICYNNPHTNDRADHAAGIVSLEHEKAIYKVLNERKSKHPNILCCILSIPEGIFLERLTTTLEFRNRNREEEPVDESVIKRWVKQLISAEAYLEELGYIHGDLRPANILLTNQDHLKLCDFDASVRPGERLRTATPGFSQVSDLKTFQPGIASCGSEQLAIGSCIFTIGTGIEPLQDAVDQVQRFFRNDFPSTNGVFLGEVIQNCWRKTYCSIAELDHVITRDLSTVFQDIPIVDDQELGLRLRECEAFLHANKVIDSNAARK